MISLAPKNMEIVYLPPNESANRRRKNTNARNCATREYCKAEDYQNKRGSYKHHVLGTLVVGGRHCFIVKSELRGIGADKR